MLFETKPSAFFSKDSAKSSICSIVWQFRVAARNVFGPPHIFELHLPIEYQARPGILIAHHLIYYSF